MWLYHEEYAELGIGAIEFYAQFPQYKKNRVDDMLTEIAKAKPQPQKKAKVRR